MLKPVLARVNYKIAASLTVTLEDLIGSNLPLLFPEVLLLNRTPTACTASVVGNRRVTYVGQSDPDFDGSVITPLFATFGIGSGSATKLSGLDQSGLLPSAYGYTNELTFTNAGPAAELRLSLLVKGLIESSVDPDPLVVVNV